MEYKNVTKISAVGTGGINKGVEFIAKPDGNGRYVLNKKSSTPPGGNNTNHAANKVYAATLTEAAAMLATDDYLINVVAPDGTRALRVFSKVSIASNQD